MMVNEIFIKLVNMSLTASVVILAVLAIRLLLRRAPKLISYCLWSVVLFRLLCPVSFSLPVSLLGTLDAPVSEQGTMVYIPENIVYTEQPAAELQTPVLVNETADTALPQNTEKVTGSLRERFSSAASGIWAAGVSLMLLYSAGSLMVLLRKLRLSSRTGEEQFLQAGQRHRIYYNGELPTALVLGVFRPKIFLPEGLSEEEKRYVLLHEEIHIRRCDHIVKIISWLALCVHWFNPLVWAAFFLSGRDMEMACDEAVLRRLGGDTKKDYSASLLSLAAGRRIVGGVPLAFGEGDTGSRIKNVLRYRKTATWMVCAAVLAAVAAAVFLLANPFAGEKESVYDPEGLWGTQIENLGWGMSMEEVEEYYTFGGEAIEAYTTSVSPDGENQILSVSRTLEYTQELYGCEMWVTLTFDHALGLTNVTGRLTDPGSLEQLAANMNKKMEDHLTYFDRDQEISWSSGRIAEAESDEKYSAEQLKEVYSKVYGEISAADDNIKALRGQAMVYVSLALGDQTGTISIRANTLMTLNNVYDTYDRQLAYREITIDGKTLVWGMSEEEVKAVLGEPGEIEWDMSGASVTAAADEPQETERAGEQRRVTLTYPGPVETELGVCDEFAVVINVSEMKDLSGRSWFFGLDEIDFHMPDRSKAEVTAALEKQYGALDEPSVWQLGSPYEEMPFYIENYNLKNDMVEDLPQGIQDRMREMQLLNNPYAAALSDYSLVSFQLRGSKEEEKGVNVMMIADMLLAKDAAMSSGN